MEHKYLFHQGSNYRSYEMFGAHRFKEGGYIFRTWAPRAVSISLVGEFNDWDLSAHMMKRLEDDDSIWEVTCKEAKAGQLYKFAVSSTFEFYNSNNKYDSVFWSIYRYCSSNFYCLNQQSRYGNLGHNYNILLTAV